MFLQRHAISLFFGYYLLSNFVSALDAPTATDGRGYRIFFRFLNGISGNWARAINNHVESSPNFNGAVQKVINGGTTK